MDFNFKGIREKKQSVSKWRNLLCEFKSHSSRHHLQSRVIMCSGRLDDKVMPSGSDHGTEIRELSR